MKNKSNEIEKFYREGTEGTDCKSEPARDFFSHELHEFTQIFWIASFLAMTCRPRSPLTPEGGKNTQENCGFATLPFLSRFFPLRGLGMGCKKFEIYFSKIRSKEILGNKNIIF
jgi:hypothetical protein